MERVHVLTWGYRCAITTLLVMHGQSLAYNARPAIKQVDRDSLPIVQLSTDGRVIGLLKDVHDVRHPKRTVIRDSTAWMEFKQSVGDKNGTILPSVDFGREMLIVATNGLRNNGEFISIERVDVQRDTLVAHVLTRVHVMPDCRDAAMYAPMAIVRVPRDARPVVFTETKRDEGCGDILRGIPQ
jgi:hypothetical protein